MERRHLLCQTCGTLITDASGGGVYRAAQDHALDEHRDEDWASLTVTSLDRDPMELEAMYAARSARR